MFGQTYYFSLIRKYTALVGSILDDITIQRTNSSNNNIEWIKVPVMYASKDKMIARISEDPKLDRPSELPTLPAITFEMGQIVYDGSRKVPTTNRTKYKKDANNFKYQYSPVPYNIEYKVYIYVKNTEDGTKIIQQILPYFGPELTFTLKLIPEMEVSQDTPVIIRNISYEDRYTGKFTDRIETIWTLDLLLKGYFYGPIQTAPIIKYANTSFYATTTNPDGSVSNNYAFSNIVQPGLTANGTPTSNSSLSIPTNEIEATDDYGFIETRLNGNGQ